MYTYIYIYVYIYIYIFLQGFLYNLIYIAHIFPHTTGHFFFMVDVVRWIRSQRWPARP